MVEPIREPLRRGAAKQARRSAELPHLKGPQAPTATRAYDPLGRGESPLP